ncbi:MAG TPA: cupredoxin domain-containing protein [Acidimicrobiia bacterium]|nr:cupredoxin domain-containing protein [Acidimicrobiia bacterium]
MRKLAAVFIVAGTLTMLSAGIALAANVNVVDDAFQPGSITVAAGESVTFTNSGESPHTATADDGSFDTGTIDPGQSATVTFDTPGRYPYFCRFHGDPGGSGMAGVVVVTGAGGGTGGGTGGTGGNAGGTGGGTGGGEVADTGAGGPLPQTASPLPFIAVAGTVLLGTGLWLGLRRRTT